MRSLARIIAVGLVCSALSGCGFVIGHALRESSRITQAESQVNATLARYRRLVVEVDAERLADMFVSAGELSHNTEPAHVGPSQIRTFLKGFAGYKIERYELRASTTTVEGEVVKQHGTYAQTAVAPSGSTIEASGDFDAAWQHQADGRWLLTRMHTTSPGTSSAG